MGKLVADMTPEERAAAKAYSAQRYLDNKDEHRARCRQNYWDNREARCSSALQNYWDNREARCAQSLEYRKNNRERARAKSMQNYWDCISPLPKPPLRCLDCGLRYYPRSWSGLRRSCGNLCPECSGGPNGRIAKNRLRGRAVNAVMSIAKGRGRRLLPQWLSVALHLGPRPEISDDDAWNTYSIDHITPLSAFDLRNPTEVAAATLPENHQWLRRRQNSSKSNKTVRGRKEALIAHAAHRLPWYLRLFWFGGRPALRRLRILAPAKELAELATDFGLYEALA
ncbi:MAG: hypothetical protein V3W44_09730 [Dehalococcoidales bacterium]